MLAAGGTPVAIRLTGPVVRSLDGVSAFALDTVDPSGHEHFMNLLLYNAPSARALEEEIETKADPQPSVSPIGEGKTPSG